MYALGLRIFFSADKKLVHQLIHLLKFGADMSLDFFL